MKKTLNVIMSAFLSVAMFANVAYIVTPEKAEESQLALAAIRAVDIQTAIGGIRTYEDLTDTTHVYQVNDPIYLATTVEVRNLETTKYRNLKSIEDKKIEVVVGGANVDLSFAKYNSPMLLSHLYSGVNESYIATLANAFSVSNFVDYDKEKNEVKITFKGYQMNSTALAANGTMSVAAIQNADGTIGIPALRLRDGKYTIDFGGANNKYTYDVKAPESLAYTAVVMGVCKDNAGAQKGDFYARIMISGAEKFSPYKDYYVNSKGQATNLSDLSGKIEFVDYVKVEVSKLEIAAGYNVYKYYVPANAMINTDIPLIYDKDGENRWYRENVLAFVNPNKYDNTTNKAGWKHGVTGINTAGGVRSVKAYTKFDKDGNPTGAQEDVPITSAMYTSKYTIYAPAFYGVAGSQTSTGNFIFFYQEDIGTRNSSLNVKFTETRVEKWEITVPASQGAALKIDVYDAGKLATGADVLTAGTVGAYDPVAVAEMYDGYTKGTGKTTQVVSKPAHVATSHYTITRKYDTSRQNCTITVTPVAQDIYPLNWADPASPTSGRQNWVVVASNFNNQTVTVPTNPGVYTNYNTVAATNPKPVPAPMTGRNEYRAGSTYAGATPNIQPFGVVLDETTKDYPVNRQFTGIYIPLKDHIAQGYSGNLTFDKDDIVSVMIGNRLTPKTGSLDTHWLTGVYVPEFSGQALADNATADFLWTLSGDGKAILVVPVKQTGALRDRWYYGVNSTIAAGSISVGSDADYRMVQITYSTEETPDGYLMADYSACSGLRNDIAGRNGISTYVITSKVDDRPFVSVASEDAYFESENGFSIALFDGYNYDYYFQNQNGSQTWAVGERIYRSNDANLSYSRAGGYVDNSGNIIKALQFFGLDTSFNTTFRINDETFENKGAAAVYSEDITGQFSYGTIEIWPDEVDESTEEAPADDEEEPPVDENGGEEEPPVDDTPDEPAPTPPVTGDASGNIAIALTASALLAAAGLVIVMKKAR